MTDKGRIFNMKVVITAYLSVSEDAYPNSVKSAKDAAKFELQQIKNNESSVFDILSCCDEDKTEVTVTGTNQGRVYG